MKRLHNLLTLMLLMCFSINADAQILDRLSKKLEKKAADRLERKIDNAMDKGLDKTEEEIDKSVTKKPESDSDKSNSSDEPISTYDSDTNTASPGGGLLGGMFKPVDVKDEYKFDMSLSYVITTISEKETSEIDYDFAVADQGSGDLMMIINDMRVNGKSEMKKEHGAMRMIFDMDNRAMITIMEEEKMYMTMNMDMGEIVQEQNEKQDYTMTKTGKTKSILGYTCEEYEVTTNETYGNVWVSSDGKLKDFNPYMAIAQSSKNDKNSDSSNPMSDIEGAMLEMNMTFKEAKKKSDPKSMSYIVTEIKEVNIKQNFDGLSNPMKMK